MSVVASPANPAAPIYCFDTSAFLHCAQRHYPLNLFPALWARLDVLTTEGRLIAPDEVLEELKIQGDELCDWCVARESAIFVPIDAAIQVAVKEILVAYPTLVSEGKGRHRADAFVIALAQLRNATVVTYEDSKPTSPKIPDACMALGIRTTRVVELARAERWTF